jgi:tRNA-dihydrouridine synthase
VTQAYIGGPDWSVIARVKQSVSIPVLGSGGIREATDVLRFLKETGADGVAIGRGCLGNPWIFSQARALLQGSVVPQPTSNERARALLQLVESEFEYYGNFLALKRLPRVSCYFAKFMPGFDEFKVAVQKVRNQAEFSRLVRGHFV